MYKKVGRSALKARYKMKFCYITNVDNLQLIPTTIKCVHKHYVKDSSSEILIRKDCTQAPLIRTEWLNVEPYRTGSESKLAESLRTGTAVAVSDGSYSEELGIGTASWVISTIDKVNMITAGAYSPGAASCQSSYQSEILGLLGILEELYIRCKTWQITSGKCRIFCDGISALYRVEEATTLNTSIRFKCVDLLSACAQLKSLIPIQLEFVHVKGHQDATTSSDNLSIPAQLNV